MSNGESEPLLIENSDRYILFPIQYPEIWDKYKTAQASFWTVEEIDVAKDLKDWQSLTEHEQHFLKHVLAFFAASDGMVGENLVTRFFSEVQNAEARCFYAFQIMIETVHSEAYSLLLQTYVTDPEERDHIFHAISTIDSIKIKAEWTARWMGNMDAPFAARLVAFAAVEGIFFCGSFAAIFWFKKRGLLPGLCFSNELISRDESLHTDFACLLYSLCQNKLPADKVQAIVKEAVDLEHQFMRDALPVRLIGMNADDMVLYVEFVADRLLATLDVEPLYNAENPFDWMELISTEGKTNFFEKRVSEYKRAKRFQAASSESEFTTEAAF